MQNPLSVKVSRAVFDGIMRAWASDPSGKLRYSIVGTAARAKRLGEREAAEWVDKHDYKYGVGVFAGFHVGDGEYPGDVDRTVRKEVNSSQTYEWPWNSDAQGQNATSGSAPSPSPQTASRRPLTADPQAPPQQNGSRTQPGPSHAQSDIISGITHAQNAPEEGPHPAPADRETPLQPPQEPSFPGVDAPHPPAQGEEGALERFMNSVEDALDDPEGEEDQP